jgi:Phage protein Gp138 N-terminal domain
MAVSNQSNLTTATEYATLQFIVQQLLSRVATATLVRVVSCTNAGGLSPVGTVDVQPLVNQIAGDGSAWPHRVLHRLPYVRMQGGANAIILDPKPGDLGLAVFASRDISAIKSDSGKGQAADPKTLGLSPGSARQFDMSDGLYVGGLLNGTPEQYVQFNEDGVTVNSPVKVIVRAPQVLVDGQSRVTGSEIVDGNVSVGTGATGTFTTGSGQTIDVIDGIVVNIS